MSKLVLKIKERINFSVFYQEKTDLVSQLMQKSINEKVSITTEDIELVGFFFNKDTSQYQWDSAKDTGKEVELSAKEVTYLQEQIKRLDAAKEVTMDIVGLCEQINSM